MRLDLGHLKLRSHAPLGGATRSSKQEVIAVSDRPNIVLVHGA
jgi:hypothetical protein